MSWYHNYARREQGRRRAFDAEVRRDQRRIARNENAYRAYRSGYYGPVQTTNRYTGRIQTHTRNNPTAHMDTAPWLSGSSSVQPSPISDQEAWRRARSDVNWTAPAAQGAARAHQLRWRRNNLSQYRERASHNPAAVRRLRGLAFGH